MKALVTGGGGFLGGAIIRLLQKRGWELRSFTRTAYPWLDELGVEQVLGDLVDAIAVDRAVAGCDVVFHVAAKAGIWGRYSDFYDTNVVGTENVVASCRKQSISKLVYTSTPSVVHTGRSHEGANESLPYARHFNAYYPATKALAEKRVLEANGPDLLTVALRPHLIWGPGDPHLVPRIVSRAKQGQLRRVGDQSITVDVTYVDNAADAHVLASAALQVNSSVAGRSYFISDGKPVDLWQFINRILAEARVEPIENVTSIWKTKLAGRVLEWVYRIFRLPGEPPMTRFLASQLSMSHWYDISAARKELGYEPRISIDEGLRKLGESLRGS